MKTYDWPFHFMDSMEQIWQSGRDSHNSGGSISRRIFHRTRCVVCTQLIRKQTAWKNAYLTSSRSRGTTPSLFALADHLDNTSNTRFRLKLGLNTKYNHGHTRHGRPALCRRFTWSPLGGSCARTRQRRPAILAPPSWQDCK